MERFFFIAGYPLRLLMVFCVCLIEPKMWDTRKELFLKWK